MRSKCCQFKLIELSEMIYMPSAFCLLPASHLLPLAGCQTERPTKQKSENGSSPSLLFGRRKEIASIWLRPLMNTLAMCKLQLRLNTYAACPLCPSYSGNFRNIGTSQCQQKGKDERTFGSIFEYSNNLYFSYLLLLLRSVGSQ